ncbi:MAG: RagB/SusD family nutrient uptake outer membrane protein [Bacteroidales bacterium]|nr:RagB/SusD family nutrient uptake outer membrane protein [Bacteroidales bacterium]
MKKNILYILVSLLTLSVLSSCAKDFLVEKPVTDIYADNLLTNYSGFESMNYALLSMVRDEYGRMDINYGSTNFGSLPFAKSTMWSCGTDNAWGNNRHTEFRFFSFPKNITGMTDANCFLSIFEWLYKVVNTANMVIGRAENEDVDWDGGSAAADQQRKAQIVAEARLYRAWAYRHLTYSFGAVPLSTEEITGANYRVDWERNSVEEIRQLMEADLKYAIENLPMRYKGNNTRPNQAVARHYLGELYLAMGKPAEAKAVLQPLVEGSDYRLMTSRFGKNASNPGSAFIDVFRSPLYSEGNNEVLWAFLNTEEENTSYGNSTVMFMRNMWVNYYSNDSAISKLTCALYPGQTPILFWSLNGGKGAGRCAISLGAFKLYTYDNQQDNDVRYDENSLVWHLYFLNDDGEEYEIPNFINLKTNAAMSNDNDPTIKQYHLPSTRKWQYVNPVFEKSNADNQFNNLVYLRLAETYLLYAEALLKTNDAAGAAEWINKVRRRANCSEIPASVASIDFILDERSRELITEEQRRETLIRLSQENGGDERLASNIFKSRVRAHNEVSGREVRGMHDDVTPVLFPIPQEFINSNTGRTIQQNPGY